VRKLEFELDEEDLRRLRMTAADYSFASIKSLLLEAVGLYRTLRNELYGDDVVMRRDAERVSLAYLDSLAAAG